MTYQIGILGLGVMGRSLAINLHRNGWRVIGYDPAPKLPADFVASLASSVAELCSELESPRMILMMVPAGKPVDAAIEALRPYLQKGDILIDGGNSFFADTERRLQRLEEDEIQFVGMGVSGGENGALLGPSLMPGGSRAAWERIRPIVQSIAAVAPDGAPCVAWMGPGGAGHYVKMVHNGIEYADMQLIAEVYDLLHRGAGFSNSELAEIFSAWNTGELRSYLMEITAHILRRREGETDLVDLILDEAAQKGTGQWASQHAFEVGVPIPTINAAVESRLLSSLKPQRVAAAQIFGQAQRADADRERLAQWAQQALYASKVTAYAQGFAMLRLASGVHGWGLNLAEIARIWRAGCIIRANLLETVAGAFSHQPDLPNLLVAPAFSADLLARQAGWRAVVQAAVGLGIPTLAMGSALAYFDAYRSEVLPANLTQAQRDYFGAHTYRRVDREGDFHTRWE